MDLVNILNESIVANAINTPRDYIGASFIGHGCNRYIWYKHQNIQGSPLSSKSIVAFEVGKNLESMIISFIEKTNIEVERPQRSNNFLMLTDADLPLKGHADAILHFGNQNSAILEIKTAKNSSFERFKKKGLKAWSSTYYSQIQSYMGLSRHKQGVLLALNKDSSEFHCEWVNFDEEHYRSLKLKTLLIASSNKEPDKINQSPLFVLCNQCQYKSICHGGEKDVKLSD